MRNINDYFRLDNQPEPLPREVRIVGLRDEDTIYVDLHPPERREQGIVINTILHYLHVYDSAHFDLARQLAEAYERRLEEGPGREFTIQKEYQG